MPSKAVMSVADRRTRLAVRTHLAPAVRAGTPAEVARDLVALHGTDPATVFLSIAARASRPLVSDIERALYEDRELVRMLGMRRTMFVIHDALASVVHSACTQAIAARLKRQYQQRLTELGGVADAPRWWSRVADDTLAALDQLGEATAQELGKLVPELKRQFRFAEGKSYAGTQSVATWMLMQLSAEGRIVRGRPRGSWISSQYRWSPIDRWLPRGLPSLSMHEAQAALIRKWLRTFGPGTVDDLKWWTGLTLGEVKRALASLEVAEVDLGESVGFVLADDLQGVSQPDGWVALLPALDVTPMAYLRREWFLGPHAPRLFDRSGNIGPTIWNDGRIVGGWAQRSTGAVVYKLLEDIGREAEEDVQKAAHWLEMWLGDVHVTPRFRTPLERELSA